MRHQAFTLLELLLVIAIITILAGLINFALNPAQRLQDATISKDVSVMKGIEDAIESYITENAGSIPFTTTNLTQTAYSICKQGETSGCDINIDTLVTAGYLANIPVTTGANGNQTGYMLKYNSKRIEVGVSRITCPTGYVGVPGNSMYQTGDFCVMKYEAKNVSTVATSIPDGTIWATLTQTGAITACSNLGSKYHLINNNEWMTIARNIEQVATNWTSGTVGTGTIFIGHSDGTPASALAATTNDNDGYNGTGQTTPSGQRRTHTLSNGEVIWDLAGNVWEMNSNTINCASSTCTADEMPYDSSPGEEWIELTTLATYGQFSYDLLRPSNPTWNTTQGIGRIYTDSTAAGPSGNIHSLRRGGRYNDGSNGGLFSVSLNTAPAYTDATLGFRCAYTV